MVSRTLIVSSCVLLIAGTWLAIVGGSRSRASVEMLAGLIIIGALVLLGFALHKITSV